MRLATNIGTQNSLSHRTVEDNGGVSSKKDSIIGSGPTFDPRINRSNGVPGVIKTPSVSQTSNVPDLKELNEDEAGGEDNAKIRMLSMMA